MSKARTPQEWRVVRLDDQVEVDDTEYDVGVALTVDSHKGRESFVEFEVVAIDAYRWERAYEGFQEGIERGAEEAEKNPIFTERRNECLIHNGGPDPEGLYDLLCPITGDDTGLVTHPRLEARRERYEYLFERVERLTDSIQASREDATIDAEVIEGLEAEKEAVCEELDELEAWLLWVETEAGMQPLPTEYLQLYEVLLEVEKTMLTPREAETFYYVGELKMAKTLVAELMNVSRQTVYNHWNSVQEKREEAKATLTFLREAEEAREVRGDVGVVAE